MTEYKPLKIRDNSLALSGVIFTFLLFGLYFLLQFYIVNILAGIFAFLGSIIVVTVTIIVLKLLLRSERIDANSNKDIDIKITIPEDLVQSK